MCVYTARRYATVLAEARADSFHCRLCNAVRSRRHVEQHGSADRSCMDSPKHAVIVPQNPLPPFPASPRSDSPVPSIPLARAKQYPVPLARSSNIHHAVGALPVTSDLRSHASSGGRQDVAAVELDYSRVAWPDPVRRCIGDTCSMLV